MKSIPNVKKHLTLSKGISSHDVCSGVKSQQVKTKHLSFSTRNVSSIPKTSEKTFSVLFHRVTFDHSVSCVLLRHKPNGSYKNYQKFERMPYPPQKRLLKKKRK